QLLESAGQGEKLGDTLLIPENMLRMGEQVFLDDMTLQEAEEKLGMRVIAVDAPGGDFVRAALDPAYGMDRENDGRRAGYSQAFDRITEEYENMGFHCAEATSTILFDLVGSLLLMAMKEFERAYFGGLCRAIPEMAPQELMKAVWNGVKAMAQN